MAVDQPRAVVLQSLILREAAGWIEALESPEPSGETLDQWLHWLGTSDAHQRAWWRMLEVWQIAESLEGTRESAT
jgi:ferric-dicitrate binding protein FerR (iron transport regulator)